jgi:aldehyde:ferredoxin oxidoreductase
MAAGCYTGEVRVPKVIKPKKKCCKSRPRCKKCPVVCKRLMNEGLAERAPNGGFVIHKKVPKKVLKAARG